MIRWISVGGVVAETVQVIIVGYCNDKENGFRRLVNCFSAQFCFSEGKSHFLTHPGLVIKWSRGLSARILQLLVTQDTRAYIVSLCRKTSSNVKCALINAIPMVQRTILRTRFCKLNENLLEKKFVVNKASRITSSVASEDHSLTFIRSRLESSLLSSISACGSENFTKEAQTKFTFL